MNGLSSRARTHVNGGKHRTEVREATEGDRDWCPKIFGERAEFPGENAR